MKRLLTVAMLFLVCSLGSGCVYVNAQYPLDDDYSNTELGAKVGRSSAHSFLWLFAWGDAGSKAAADNGNITVLKHADVQVFTLGFGLIYQRVTTVIYGD